MPRRSNFCGLVLVLIVASVFCQAQNEDMSDEANTDAGVLRHKAEAGDIAAQYELGHDAEQMEDYQEAFKWFQLAAKQGLNVAQVDLAYLYATGFGAQKDLEQAVHWYSLAAAQNNPDAEYSLGVCYLQGLGVQQDITLARKWISQALRDGDGARSENEMGLTYEIGPELELAEAFKWYNKAAESGYRDAQYNVCRLTAQGLAAPVDYAAALKWCSTLAEKGDLWGEYGMGLICEKGVGMPPDLKRPHSGTSSRQNRGIRMPNCG